MLAALLVCLIQLALPEPRLPDTYLARFDLAWSALSSQRFDDAARAYRACLELDPENSVVAFHLACTFAQKGEHAPALEWLAKAADWGYADAPVAEWVPALEPLRGRASFAESVRRMRNHAARLTAPDTGVFIDGRALGRELARGSDGRLSLRDDMLWTTDPWKPVAQLAPNEAELTKAVFAPSGDVLATLADDGIFAVWSTADGRRLARLGARTTWKGLPAFSADGRRVSCSQVGAEHGVTVWQLPEGRPLGRFGGSCDQVLLNATGDRLVTLDGSHAWIWDVDEQRVIERIRGVKSVRLAKDRLVIQPVRQNEPEQRFDLASGAHLKGPAPAAPPESTPTHPSFPFASQIRRLRLLPNGTHAVLAGPDGRLRLIDLAQRASSRVLDAGPAQIGALEPSPTGEFIAACDRSGQAWLWNLRHANPAAQRITDADSNFGGTALVAFSPDGAFLAVRSPGAEVPVTVLDLATAEPLARLTTDAFLGDLAWSADSSRLFGTGHSNEILIWDPHREDPRLETWSCPAPMSAVRAHPNGRWLVTAGRDLFAYLWNAESGELLARREFGRQALGVESIHELQFSADGSQLLVTVGGCWGVFAADPATLEIQWELDFGGGTPAPLGLAPDPSRGRLGLVQKGLVLDLASGEIVHELAPYLTELAFTPDGAHLVGIHHEGRVRATQVLRVLDAESFTERYRRAEYAGGGSLSWTSSLYFAGDVELAHDRFLQTPAGRTPLSRRVTTLYDPLRLQAAAVGVRSLRPQL